MTGGEYYRITLQSREYGPLTIKLIKSRGQSNAGPPETVYFVDTYQGDVRINRFATTSITEAIQAAGMEK